MSRALLKQFLLSASVLNFVGAAACLAQSEFPTKLNSVEYCYHGFTQDGAVEVDFARGYRYASAAKHTVVVRRTLIDPSTGKRDSKKYVAVCDNLRGDLFKCHLSYDNNRYGDFRFTTPGGFKLKLSPLPDFLKGYGVSTLKYRDSKLNACDFALTE